MVEVRVYMVIKPPTRNAVHFAPFSNIIFAPHHILLIFYNSQQSKIKNQLSKAFLVILTSSAIDKKLEIDKKKLENKLEIYKNLEFKLEIYKKISNLNSKFIAILNSKINSKFSSFLSMIDEVNISIDV